MITDSMVEVSYPFKEGQAVYWNPVSPMKALRRKQPLTPSKGTIVRLGTILAHVSFGTSSLTHVCFLRDLTPVE